MELDIFQTHGERGTFGFREHLTTLDFRNLEER